MKTKIVTARINETLKNEIEFLKTSLGLSNTTAVLTHAIHVLYHSLKEKEKMKSSLELFEEMGLMGCFNGAPDLSVTYKDKIANGIVKKHRKSSKKRALKRRRNP